MTLTGTMVCSLANLPITTQEDYSLKNQKPAFPARRLRRVAIVFRSEE